MADASNQSEGDARKSRRRSMLPQLQSRPASRVASPTKSESVRPDVPTPDPLPYASATLPSRIMRKNVSSKGSMPPPSYRPSRAPSAESTAVARPSLASSVRQSSNVKAPETASLKAPKQRSTSSSRPPPAGPRQSFHARSTSHQITSISTPAPSTTLPRRESLRLQKPTFNTFQQHYSPLKQSTSRPKSRIQSQKFTTTSSPTPESDNTGPSIPHAQSAELLQLHRLHSLAEPTLTAWSKSAESHYRTRFSDLAARTAELHAIASEQQGLLNALALVEWGAGIPSAVIGEKVEVLSRDIEELEGMVAPEGKFERVGVVWETWFEEAERVRDGRKSGTGSGERFVEGIGDGWKAEAMVLERELGYVRKDMEGFGEVKEGSGLGRVVGLGMTLCQGLLEELDVMQWIEGEVMRAESVWFDEMVGQLGKGVSDGMAI